MNSNKEIEKIIQDYSLNPFEWKRLSNYRSAEYHEDLVHLLKTFVVCGLMEEDSTSSYIRFTRKGQKLWDKYKNINELFNHVINEENSENDIKEKGRFVIELEYNFKSWEYLIIGLTFLITCYTTYIVVKNEREEPNKKAIIEIQKLEKKLDSLRHNSNKAKPILDTLKKPEVI